MPEKNITWDVLMVWVRMWRGLPDERYILLCSETDRIVVID